MPKKLEDVIVRANDHSRFCSLPAFAKRNPHLVETLSIIKNGQRMSAFCAKHSCFMVAGSELEERGPIVLRRVKAGEVALETPNGVNFFKNKKALEAAGYYVPLERSLPGRVINRIFCRAFEKLMEE